jgi:hypothetical protein
VHMMQGGIQDPQDSPGHFFMHSPILLGDLGEPIFFYFATSGPLLPHHTFPEPHSSTVETSLGLKEGQARGTQLRKCRSSMAAWGQQT